MYYKIYCHYQTNIWKPLLGKFYPPTKIIIDKNLHEERFALMESHLPFVQFHFQSCPISCSHLLRWPEDCLKIVVVFSNVSSTSLVRNGGRSAQPGDSQPIVDSNSDQVSEKPFDLVRHHYCWHWEEVGLRAFEDDDVGRQLTILPATVAARLKLSQVQDFLQNFFQICRTIEI